MHQEMVKIVLLLFCPEKRILADFEAYFLDFKYASNGLVIFVIYACTSDLFVYGHSVTHSYMPDDIVGGAQCTVHCQQRSAKPL